MRRHALASALRTLALAALLAAGALSVSPERGGASEPGRGLHQLRSLYLGAVADEGAIDRGLAEIRALRERESPPAGSWADAALSAYHGAFVTLRAKHALWPPAKLRHLRDGLAALDEVVARHPRHVEARYLRLMSCYYLPGFLGRGDSVREDFQALARLLPDAREGYPPELYASMVRFVLEEARLTGDARRPLEAVLASTDE